MLTAEDGRNIEVTYNGTSGLGFQATAPATSVERASLTLSSENNIVIGDTNGAAAAQANEEVLIGLSATTVAVTSASSVTNIDVTDREGANEAIGTLDVALKQVAESRGELGAIQNRMASTVRNLEVASENLSASRSRIMDADFAQETAAFSRNQIMQQAGVSVLAQANQQPQIALALLS